MRLIGSAIATLIALACFVPAASAQTTGNSLVGEALFASTCVGCHSVASLRTQITNRAPSGLNFAKSLAALNAALTGTDLDAVATGMGAFASLTTAQRGDLAAYISGAAAPASGVRLDDEFPQIGPVAVGSTITKTLRVTNSGTADLVFPANGVASIATGGDAADFRVTSTDCPTMTLPVGSATTCRIDVAFQPAAGVTTARYASLGIASNAPTKLVQLVGTISGSGGTAATPPTTSPTPAPGAGSANAPSSGGGGSLHWAVLGLLGLLAVRRSRRA